MLRERAALMAGVREAPDDDLPRLACADWFEERGDEESVSRAEFIRLQVRRARLAADDPAHSELQARELRLLKRYAPLWCGSHFVFEKVRFRRGFIECVHLHLRHFLHHRRQMLALEPVRDISLTGWYRASDDLVRRVAACKEWQEIGTLRIHHQGPHHDPRGNLMILLESPHLSRLRALHGVQVEFDADARRRFERLPMLRQLTELHFPTLSSYPHNPGNWFHEGGAEFAEQWGGLRSLTLPYIPSIDLLRRLSAMPWWNRLTSLRLQIPYRGGEALPLLRARLPEGLEELRLAAGSVPADLAGLEPFLDRLVAAPLRSLQLQDIPLRATTLARLLEGTGRRLLSDLRLIGCNTSAEHAHAFRESKGIEGLSSLDILDHRFDATAARVLFSSPSLRSLVHLDLESTDLDAEAARALTAAPALAGLRSLAISCRALAVADAEALFAAPPLRGLNWLALECGHETGSSLDVSPDLARAIAGLPHLAHLRLSVHRLGATSRLILDASPELAWQSITTSDVDIGAWRAMNAPDRTPPLDAALEEGFPGR